MVTNSSKYYSIKQSNSASAIFLALITGTIVAFLSSFLYNFLTYINPLEPMNFLIAIVFGFLISWGTMLGYQLAKGKNVMVASLLGIIVGVIGTYFAWLSWFKVYGGEFVFVDLVTLFGLMEEVAQKGHFAFKGRVIKGQTLEIIWFIEFVVITGCSFLGMRGMMKDSIFCTTCNKWADNIDSYKFATPAASDADLIRRIQDGDYSDLEKTDDKESYLKLEIRTCHSCNNLTVLDLSKIYKVEYKFKGGRYEYKTLKLIDKLLIDKQKIEKIKNHLE